MSCSMATSSRLASFCSAIRMSTENIPTGRCYRNNDPFSTSLPAAEDVPEMRDLGRNGTYLVLRQLKQDVRGFWRFADLQANSDPRDAAKAGRIHGGPYAKR